MPAFPLVVSFYTQDTLYQMEVKNLIASCEQWGLEHHIEPIQSFGSWELNCAFKPFFLYSKLQEFQRPLFWVDADGVFVKRPEYLKEFEADFSCRINRGLPDTHPSKVMSGSLFINATPGAERILKLWAKECYDKMSDPERVEEVWDQALLRDVIARNQHGAKIMALPPSYTAIVDHPIDSEEIGEPVIAHHQASRRYKKMINDQGDVAF